MKAPPWPGCVVLRNAGTKSDASADMVLFSGTQDHSVMMRGRLLYVSMRDWPGGLPEALPDDPGEMRWAKFRSMVLTPEDARELFNFLGVWLHKIGDEA